eukprot:10620109-Alexandrium_andersonii.AAC.1
MWSTWGGREPPRDPDAPVKLKAPFEGTQKKIFHEQDFVRIDVGNLDQQTMDALDIRIAEQGGPRRSAASQGRIKQEPDNTEPPEAETAGHAPAVRPPRLLPAKAKAKAKAEPRSWTDLVTEDENEAMRVEEEREATAIE